MARVSSILIYPERDQPGQTLGTSYVSSDGLDGDRRKKSAVHVVAVENYIDHHPRANLVVDIPSDDLHDLVGRRLRIGTTELEVTQLAGNCPGVYAEVPIPGDVSIGDEVLVGVQPE
jgi:MOSC domain-containing protein YiiM